MADKVFKEYISDSEKDYKFTLKLAVNEVTDKMKDKLEYCLSKYQLKFASDFKKTPIQESPLDFPNVKYSSVSIAEIVTTYPATRDFLENYISSALGLSEQCVVVYSENDPRQSETDFFLEVSDPEYKENYSPVLGEDGYEGDLTNAEGGKLYGDEYNMSFLKTLEDKRKERSVDIVETPLSVAEVNDNSTTLPDGYHDYNKESNINTMSIFGRPPKKPELINKS